MTRISRILFVLLASILTLSANACILRDGDSVATVNLPTRTDNLEEKFPYDIDLLQLILQKSAAKYGPCEIRLVDLGLPTARRNLHSVEQGAADVLDALASTERDKRLLAVRIPILKGLMGYRLFFIRREDQAKYSAVHTVNQLKKFSIGQGYGWEDAEILRVNGFKVVYGSDQYSLISMLKANRFDIYSRGAGQIIPEFQALNDPQISIENTVAIAYLLPAYFYVSRQNIKLAERLEYGLTLAIEDGSFDTLFYSHPSIRDSIGNLAIGTRKMFYLCNPKLSPNTPVKNAKLWLHPWPEYDSCKKPQETPVLIKQK